MNNFNGGNGLRLFDEELIQHLKNRTMFGCDYFVQEITDLGVDICNWEPWELPCLTNMATSSDETWYFFYPISYKYPECKTKKPDQGPNGKRKQMINRATRRGKWKPSGDPRKVRARDSNKEIGLKRSLYFYMDQVDEENNKKRKANSGQNSYQNKSDNKKSKAKKQNSYQNKTPWVLYEFELIDVHPSENKLVLGKLMKQSKIITSKSSSNDETSQSSPPEEMEVFNDNDWIQNQSSISEQDNETVTSFPVHNFTTYPEGIIGNQESFVNHVNHYEVSKPQSSLENYYFPDDALADNLQVEYMKQITASEPPNMYIGAQSQLHTNQYDNSFQNLVSFHNNETYPVQSSNQQNVLVETEGFSWPYDFNNHPIADTSQMKYSLDLDDLYRDGIFLDELFRRPTAPNNFDGVQNLTNTNQQHADEFGNLNPIDNQIAFLDERNKPAAVATEGSNLPSLGMTQSSYPIMESWSWIKSWMEHEGTSIDIENEEAQAQAKMG